MTERTSPEKDSQTDEEQENVLEYSKKLSYTSMDRGDSEIYIYTDSENDSDEHSEHSSVSGAEDELYSANEDEEQVSQESTCKHSSSEAESASLMGSGTESEESDYEDYSDFQGLPSQIVNQENPTKMMTCFL